jgi:hypothetical protein
MSGISAKLPKKIFLNMASKNGTPELISMLQYMKSTRIDNPEIADMLEESEETIKKVVEEIKNRKAGSEESAIHGRINYVK